MLVFVAVNVLVTHKYADYGAAGVIDVAGIC